MCVTPPKRCAALDMYTATLRGLRIIASIPKAAPVVTAARTTITLAWGIYLSIAMGMAAVILMSMSRQSMMTAAVAMTMVLMRLMNTMSTMSTRMMSVAVVMSTTMNRKSMKRMNVAAVMSTTMIMKSISTMNVAVAMSIMSTIMSMCQVIQRIVSAKFAILMRNIAISVAKA